MATVHASSCRGKSNITGEKCVTRYKFVLTTFDYFRVKVLRTANYYYSISWHNEALGRRTAQCLGEMGSENELQKPTQSYRRVLRCV